MRTLGAILAVSLLTNIYWFRKYVHPESLPSSPKAGEHLPALNATDLSGKKTTVSWKENRQVLMYVFEADCYWCDLNVNNIISLHDQLSGRVDFIGVALSPQNLGTSLAKHKYPFPIVVRQNDPRIRPFFLGTPAMYLVSPAGVIQTAWEGALTGKRRQEVEARFGVTLPGVSDDDRTVSACKTALP